MAYDDPAGEFLVDGVLKEVAMPGPGNPPEDYTVRVTQTFPTGTECQSWEGRNATRLMRQIALAVPHLQTGHALYLGGEIGRACRCLKTGVGFTQDSAAGIWPQ